MSSSFGPATETAQLSLLDWGAASAQGSRPAQEDRYTCLPPSQFTSSPSKNLAYFAVYDGHGDMGVAEYARKTLHLRIAEHPSFRAQKFGEAIQDALQQQDKQLLSDFAAEKNNAAISGSTVALCVIDLVSGELSVANVGDSHIVLGEMVPTELRPKCIPRRLTRAHKPGNPEEESRIEEAGGYTRRSNAGSIRVGALDMSRALGDLQYKEPLNELATQGVANAMTETGRAPVTGDFVSIQPHLSRYELNLEYRNVLILGTDGLFNCIDDGPLCELVADKSAQGIGAQGICREVVSKCASYPQSDNSTCIIVFLGDR